MNYIHNMITNSSTDSCMYAQHLEISHGSANYFILLLAAAKGSKVYSYQWKGKLTTTCLQTTHDPNTGTHIRQLHRMCHHLFQLVDPVGWWKRYSKSNIPYIRKLYRMLAVASYILINPDASCTEIICLTINIASSIYS